MRRFSGVAHLPSLALVLACIVGCEPGYIQRTQKFAEHVKTVVNPNELQAWATNLIATTPTPPDQTPVKASDIPPYIRAIDKEQTPDVYVSNWGGRRSVVEIWYGGGFGHWGLVIGPPEWRAANSKTHYLLEWKPGIYFWSGL